MKVVCVNSSPLNTTHIDIIDTFLIEGNIYTVQYEVSAKTRQGDYRMNYKLEEFPHPYAFNKSRFIPLSDIDELVLVNNKELVNE